MKYKITIKLLIFILALIMGAVTSCEQKATEEKKKTPAVHKECKPAFEFDKKSYQKKDPLLFGLFNITAKIDSIIDVKTAKTRVKNINKFGSFIVYEKEKRSLKLINEIYLRDLNLAATKHEIFFIDECNIIAKMTKYVYRSNRIKSVYYFSFHNQKYVGSIVSHGHSFFHKTEKWTTITNDIIARNWSERIYRNMIKPHL